MNEKRSEIALERFHKALALKKHSLASVVEEDRWRRLGLPSSPTTLRRWETSSPKGIPIYSTRKRMFYVRTIAEYFQIPEHCFTNAELSEREFEEIVLNPSLAIPQKTDRETVEKVPPPEEEEEELPKTDSAFGLLSAIGLHEVFQVLKAVATNRDAIVRVENGRIKLDGVPVPRAFADGSDESLVKTRISLLCERLGIQGKSPVQIASLLEKLLSRGRTFSGVELVEALDSDDLIDDEIERVLKQWRDRVESRLFETTPGFDFGESRSEAAEKSLGEGPVSLDPLLRDWPLRLLTHPDWAYADSALPGVPPMALADVWVDILLVDPAETSRLLAKDDLTGSLEARYEEDLWLAEPARFVLDRLRGSEALVGAPGIGKTTFLKWMSRQFILGRHSRFLLPLFVPLRKYALSEKTERGILGFALRQAGIRDPEQIGRCIDFLSYLAGSAKNNVILLLDGYDEVPAEHREALLNELYDVGWAFSLIVTSRPSAYPRGLPVDNFFEISELSPESVDRLARNWFGSIGDPEGADRLLGHLDRNPDVKALARNPLLLTLLCGICHCGKQTPDSGLPDSRTSLYRETVAYIRGYHTKRYPEAPFDEHRQKQVERLAFELTVQVPDAPRYVFGGRDVIECTDDEILLRNVLLPSCLVTQWHWENESLHFLHASFQEYFTARFIGREQEERLVEYVRSRFYDTAWREIFRFLSGSGGRIRKLFWEQVRSMVRVPDRFELVFTRLASLLTETGVRDGGKKLLGFDVRDIFWKRILEGIAIDVYVDAYAKMDPEGYVARVKKHTKTRFFPMKQGD